MKYDGVSRSREEFEIVKLTPHKIANISKWPNNSTIFLLPVL